ncbi:MAG TPA: hypothetical protein VG101_02705 [Puia sp.]|jgi:hypothetical protein|nr:hypothetical protein [Puia sp.]
MKTKSYRRYRSIFAYGWLAFFLICIFIALFIYAKDWIDDEGLKNLLKHLSEIYLPFLGTILTHYWTLKVPVSTSGKSDTTGLALAGICSVLWNILIVFFLIPLAFGHGTLNKAISNIDFIGQTFSWLVAGCVGYYFATDSKAVTGK